jgi:hypothetical protein
MLSEKEKQEFTAIAEPRSLKDDMRYLTENRHNPFLKDGKVDIDRYIDFLNAYNEFISHKPKPFKPMIDKIMKL